MGQHAGAGVCSETSAQVTELVLRGIFLCRRKEIDWFYQEGASWIFPDVWEEYLKVIPEAERGNMVGAYYRRLVGSDKQERLAAASAWSVWEGSTSKLFLDHDAAEKYGDPRFALAFARIECHYFMNNLFSRPTLPDRTRRCNSSHTGSNRSGAL